MPTTVAKSQVGTGLITLTANTVETVTFTDNIGAIEVISPVTNTADIWYSIDGTDPTVGGSNCWYLPPGNVDARQTVNAQVSSLDVVKLISSGSPSVRVQQTSVLGSGV